MKSKLTELEKLKLWLDAEISLMHIMFAILAFMIVTSAVLKVLIVLYIIWSFIYMIVRLAAVAVDDPNFLRIPRR